MNGDQNNDWRMTGFGPNRVSAASRVIPSPSNTNWNATFNQNNPASPSGTDWAKTFGNRNNSSIEAAGVSPARSTSPSPTAPYFNFDLSPTNDRSQLSLGNNNGAGASPASDFYRDRLANSDLTLRDRQLYGAGDNYGFNSY